jgi:uncharacterized protein
MIGGYEPSELALLAGATFVAGLVRGFSGFGTAMIYLPVAGLILSPFAALTTIVIFDLVGPLPNVRRAFREGEPADVGRLLAGLVVALPLGLYVLTLVAPEVFRFAVSIIALIMLACLVSGIRYHGPMTPPLVFGTGGLAGFLYGVAGLPGPPVILLYMSSTRPAEVIRANTLLFLYLSHAAMLPALAFFGRLDGSSVLLGVLLIIPTLAGNIAGAALFKPELERVYRTVAYLIIAASAISGMPIWG